MSKLALTHLKCPLTANFFNVLKVTGLFFYIVHDNYETYKLIWFLMSFSVANAELQGADNKAAAQVQQWISFSDNEVLPAACTWVFPCLGITQYNKQVG